MVGGRLVAFAVSNALVGVLAVASAGPVRAAPPIGSVLSATDLGPIVWDGRILGRDGGYSVLWDGKSIWTFGDTGMSVTGADGDNWADNTRAVTGDLDGADGVSLVPPAGQEDVDGVGAPAEYLPWSQWESYFNYVNDPVRCGQSGVGDCGKQYFLWPGPMIPDLARNRILYFYYAGLRGGSIGTSTWQNWGSGIAVYDATTGRLTRPETGPPPGGASWDRWTLFGANEQDYYGTTVVGSTLYSTGCLRDWVVFHCSMARVDLADVLNRSAWQYYAGNEQWSSNIADAVPIFDGGHANSIFYNSYLGKYVAVYGFDKVYYRTADQPWGPWSGEAKLFDGVAPDVNYNYFALAHPEYGDGRTIYVSYYRPKTNGGEVRLTKVVFN